MTSRRAFLKTSGVLAVAGAVAPAVSLFGAPTPNMAAVRPVGLQLFTLFRLMNEDPKATLEKVAAAGYQEVESAFSMQGRYYGFSAKEFRKIVSDLGMVWRGHHASGAPFRPRPAGGQTPGAGASGAAAPTVGGAPGGQPQGGAPAGGQRPDFSRMTPPLNLRDNYQQLVDDAAEAGLSYLVCASTPVGTLDEIQKSIEVFQKTGEACKKAGIGFAYHNHATEFDAVEGGKTPYELILSQTDKDLVKMELDLAWAVKAGKDPVELFKGQPGRFPLLHIKDIKSDLKTITEVGNGVVDFKKILAASAIAGVKHIFVEQDMAADPIASIATSIANLKKLTA